MSRPATTAPRGFSLGPLAPWLAGLAILAVALLAGLVVVQLLIGPPRNEMWDLALYFAVAGAGTMAGGWVALRFADRTVRLSIRTKLFVSTAIGTAVALLNVFIVAQLMFVSTGHDLRLLASLIVFSGIVTTAFSLWVASTLTARVQGIAGAIRGLTEGRYDQRLNMGGGDEMAALAGDVERLAAMLREASMERARLERERRELTAAISHDLRTPLASVSAMAEALSDGVVDDPAEVARYFEAMRREIERLDRMIDDLFTLARMDAGALSLTPRLVALEEIAAEVVSAMQAQASRQGLDLTLEVAAAPPPLLLDGDWIERAIGNLVSNALEHTEAGGHVEVRVGLDAGSALLEVHDSGEGIASADLPRVWDRFYRGEASRHRRDDARGGGGLGLAIVRGAVEAHGGTVAVTSTPGAGATFSLRLPLEGRLAGGRLSEQIPHVDQPIGPQQPRA
ncbi:MAG: HAMP domain-containing sensor histidine kinase [Dehalococcoidia bacterium]